jgi:hypothetical protein
MPQTSEPVTLHFGGSLKRMSSDNWTLERKNVYHFSKHHTLHVMNYESLYMESQNSLCTE